MKITVMPNFAAVSDMTAEEHAVLFALLYFQDPNAADNYDYKQGNWDGYRNCFLNADGSAFAVGHVPYVLLALGKAGITPTIERRDWPEVPIVNLVAEVMLPNPEIKLRPYQIDAVRSCIERRRGVVHAPPRSGKTIMQIAAAHAIDQPSLLLVEKETLLHQHYELFLRCGVNSVGRLGGGRWDSRSKHLIATFQTLHRKLGYNDPETLDIIQSRVVMQADEVHHVASAQTYYQIFSASPAPYRLGWSGTPFRVNPKTGRWNFDDFCLLGLCGPRIYHVSTEFLIEQGYIVPPTVIFIPIDEPKFWSFKGGWQQIYTSCIMHNDFRNKVIVNVTKFLVEGGRQTLILVKNLEHADSLLWRLHEAGINVAISKGGRKVRRVSLNGGIVSESGSVADMREELSTGKIQCVIGTSVWDEGVDVPELSAAVIAGGGKSEIKTLQRAFRPLTASEGKANGIIIDFSDETNGIMKSHAQQRLRTYQEEGFKVVTQITYDWRDKLGLTKRLGDK